MNAGWIIFGVCVVFILGAAIPLLKSRGTNRTPLPPRKETLHDWRNEKWQQAKPACQCRNSFLAQRVEQVRQPVVIQFLHQRQ